MSSTDKIEQFQDFLYRKLDNGVLSAEEFDIVLDELSTAMKSAGFDGPSRASSSNSSLLPVIAQGLFLMKQKLIEIHPELATEIEALGNSGMQR